MHDKMKKILYVATVDFNKYGGGSQAVRAYLDSVIDIYGNESVDVLVGEEFNLLEEYKDLNCIRIPKRSKLKGLYEFFKGVMVRWTIPLLQYLKMHHNEYECVIINSTRSGNLVPSIKKMGLKVVTIHHNDEVEYCMDNKNIYTLGGMCSFLVNYAQKQAYLYSDINLFLTFQDKEKFNVMYGKNISLMNEVIGVYDYKSAIKVVPSTDECKFHIGMSGSLVNYQTTHGIMDIWNNYMDIIQELIPSYKLLLTGRNPSNDILQFANAYPSHVTIIPNPQDIVSVIQKCAIYLCPTDIGGGLKLRVMDGLKSGLPVLVHKVSARGYDMFVEKPYFRVYDDKESFKKGFAHLLKFVADVGIEERQKISKDFYSYFSYESGTERLRKLLLEYK